MQKRSRFIVGVVASLFAVPAMATVLLPGSGPVMAQTVAAAPGGAVLATASNTITTPTWWGIARTAVVDGPEAGINLDFYYQLVRQQYGIQRRDRTTHRQRLSDRRDD